jgi:hypothetical protein
MMQVISALKGFAIEASDGKIGTVADFLFDDASWRVCERRSESALIRRREHFGLRAADCPDSP